MYLDDSVKLCYTSFKLNAYTFLNHKEGGNPWQAVHLAAMMLLVKSFVLNAVHLYNRQVPAQVDLLKQKPVPGAVERLNLTQHSACIADHR
jgi:hypothetical protein